MYTNRKLVACPSCGNQKEDDRIFRCPKCGKLVCEQCSYYNCIHCDAEIPFSNQVATIGPM